MELGTHRRSSPKCDFGALPPQNQALTRDFLPSKGAASKLGPLPRILREVSAALSNPSGVAAAAAAPAGSPERPA